MHIISYNNNYYNGNYYIDKCLLKKTTLAKFKTEVKDKNQGGEFLKIMEQQEYGKELERLLKAINGMIAHRIREVFAPLGITRSQSMMLLMLKESGKAIEISEFTKEMKTPASNITNISNRLEGIGYITKVRDSADRRKVSVTLTNEGIKVVDKIGNAHERLISSIAKNSKAEHRDDIIDGLSKLYESINITF